MVQQGKMILAQLLKELGNISSDLDDIVQDITLDSKNINKNTVFVALKGNKFDGNNYIKHAFIQGAIAILSDNKDIAKQYDKVFYIEDLKTNLVKIAKLFYHKLPQNFIAVTGTNGKTSIVDFARQLYLLLNHPIATLGTMGFYFNNLKQELTLPLNHTTPDIISFYKCSSKALKKEVNNLIFEASSHAIDQGRIAGIKVDIAVFSNLTQDHLDYHHNMENYFFAKAKLFSEYLSGDGIAVINADSDYAARLKEICQNRNIAYFDYGKSANSLKLLGYKDNMVEILYQDNKYKFNFNLGGEFQIYNLLSALAILLNNKFAIADIISKIPFLRAVEGRLQEVAIKKDFRVFIDYAHTPDALKNLLITIKEFAQSKIILVFGCGGERDKEKRPLMGKVANQYSDYMIITDDNPRNEGAAIIRQEIMQSIEDKQKSQQIADRKEAIHVALKMAQKNDIILVAGKGHETYQIIADKKYFFSDSKVVTDFFKD